MRFTIAVIAALVVQLFMLLQCSFFYLRLRLRAKRSSQGMLPASPGVQNAKLSIIIPAYNEADGILNTLNSVVDAADDDADGELEIVVVDAGCTDDTMDIVRRWAAGPSPPVVCAVSQGGRGPALQEGVKVSSGEVILFLHADCILPEGYDALIRNSLALPGTLASAFRFQVDRQSVRAPVPGFSVMEMTVGIRAKYLQLPFGDQALAITRQQLEAIGGIVGAPIMEDFAMVQTLRQWGAEGRGWIHIIDRPALCSGRRWEKLGVWRTNLVNQLTMIWYFSGATPQQIFDFYYGKKSDHVPRWMQFFTKMLK